MGSSFQIRLILLSVVTFVMGSFVFLDSTSNLANRFPATGDEWEQVSNGSHSFRQLGADFFVPLSMKKVEGAQVVLINERVAKMLGLSTPEDIRRFESMIVKEFAYMVDSNPNSTATDTKNWFATRYQDSNSKGPGEAHGDGRAAWAGELVLETSEGNKRHVDFVLKGTGQTPLAWTNHTQETHKDGLQGLKEAVHSYIISEANAQNQLDTTVDLAVIKLPIKRIDKEGNEVFTAITLRVGNQTRLAHLRYFTDEPERFKRIFHYIIKRDLGLSENTPIQRTHVDDFLNQFIDNLSDEMARYYDLHVTHGSPTPGNRTTAGSSIDLSTMRYHDAHHGNFKYLAGMQMKNQEDHLQSYIRSLYIYMQQAGYPYQVTENIVREKEAYYRKRIDQNLEKLWLSRLGLSDGEISRLNKLDKEKFVQLLKEMHALEGKTEIRYAGKDMLPAAFDMRKIISGAAQSQIDILAGDEQAFTKLLQSDKTWDSLSDLEKLNWQNKFSSLYLQLTSQLNPSMDQRKAWARKSAWLTKDKSPIRGQSKLKNRELDLIEKMTTDTGTLSDWNKEANNLALELKDEGRPDRAYNNLGIFGEISSINRGAFSGCARSVQSILRSQ